MVQPLNALAALADVRYGSKADMCTALAHVRFGPEADMRTVYSITNLGAVPYGCLAGPICGVRTGFAMPKKTVTP